MEGKIELVETTLIKFPPAIRGIISLYLGINSESEISQTLAGQTALSEPHPSAERRIRPQLLSAGTPSSGPVL